MSLTIGIDASRNRSGGAIAHLIGILKNLDPEEYGIRSVHVWSYQSLLDKLPKTPWLFQHSRSALEGSLARQLMWQAYGLKRELKTFGCDVCFTTDASTLCTFKPMIVLSQDLLSYEPGVMRYFGFGFARLRLIAILLVQNLAFRRADGVIFLTKYAGNLIQKSCGVLSNVAYVPHGVDPTFKGRRFAHVKFELRGSPIKCIYVSNTEMYKHQWIVVDAIFKLRRLGYNLSLLLVGGGSGPAQDLLQSTMLSCDPQGEYIKQLPFLPHDDLPALLAESDIFVFASSCENLPITLIEGMAMGIPIACSNRGPMPEVLQDAGVYFDPQDSQSISEAIEKLVNDSPLRLAIGNRALQLADQYSWENCSVETFDFIVKTYYSSCHVQST